MKTYSRFIALLCAFLFVSTAPLLAQGSLTPPGPPTPTMKTLDQIEPRKEINAINTPGDASSLFKITTAGSYYLSSNIAGVLGKRAMTVTANDVSIDLNGFQVAGAGGSPVSVNAGIYADNSRNLEVRNGSVTGWGSSGIDTVGVLGARFENLRVSDNGSNGIDAGGGAVASHCTANGNGGAGFTSTQTSNGMTIFDACSASDNTTSGFIVTGTVSHCVAKSNGTGFSINGSSIMIGCDANSNDVGIVANNGALVRQNVCAFNATAGVRTPTLQTRVTIQENSIFANGIGIDVDSVDNVIVGNVVRNNTDNYDIVPGNQVEILLCQLPETIEVPAKVTLAGKLTGLSGSNGITVTSDDVTIDLNGHALVGVSGSLDGISVSGTRANVSVGNGIVRNWGGDGIDTSSSTGGSFSDLELHDNGESGLESGGRAQITKINSRLNGAGGIQAAFNARIAECHANVNTGIGITSGNGSTIEHCTTGANTTHGIQAGAGSQILSNTCDSHASGAGIRIIGDKNRIDSNSLSRNSIGIEVIAGSTRNAIIRNSSLGDTTPYSIVAGNDVGPIGPASGATNPFANISF